MTILRIPNLHFALLAVQLALSCHCQNGWAQLVAVNSVETSQADRSLEIIRLRGKLIWGADEEGGGPFVYPNPDNPRELLGFEVDIANRIAEKLGVAAEFQQGQWEKLPDLLNRGDIDIVLNGYEWTDSRGQRFGCSIPYYIYELQLLGKKSESASNSGSRRMQTWDEFFHSAGSGRTRIGVLGGSAAYDYLDRRHKQQVDIVQFEALIEAMRAVELEIDGVQANLQDMPVWQFYQSGFLQLEPIGHPVGRGYYVVMTRKQDTQLLKAINQSLLEMLSDGSMRQILEKYRLWNDTQAERGLQIGSDGGFIRGTPSLESSSQANTNSFASERGWAVVRARGGLLVQSALITILLAVVSMPLAIAAGMLLSILRLFGWRWMKFLVTSYIEIVRGTPLVLQLYVIFFLMPELGLSIHAFWAGVLGLAINYSAYEAEIYRAGIQAIPKGQWEAATALGMSRWQTLRRVIMPQATRIVIPPVTNDFIALFKDTAVCSVITVVELSKEYSIHARSTGAIVELGIVTAVLYLLMSYPLSQLAGYLERHLNREART
ncbi:MAG: ABC transporter permease subunit [Pirellulales bacterium]